MNDIDVLARILFLVKYRSRRQAKREIREAGGQGNAHELDTLLGQIDAHARREEIVKLADQLGAAHRQAEAAAASPQPSRTGCDHDDWIMGEGATSGRTYLVYIGPDAAFVGEIFDAEAEAPQEQPRWPLDDGQVLGNVLWLEDPPAGGELAALMVRAREQVRIYDAVLDLGTE